MNLQHTSTLNSLQIQTVSALLMLQINGSPLAVWPVIRYVTSWLKNGRHAATDKCGKSQSTLKRLLQLK